MGKVENIMEESIWKQLLLLEIGIVKGSLSSMKVLLAEGKGQQLISDSQYETLIILSESSELNILEIYQHISRSLTS